MLSAKIPQISEKSEITDYTSLRNKAWYIRNIPIKTKIDGIFTSPSLSIFASLQFTSLFSFTLCLFKSISDMYHSFYTPWLRTFDTISLSVVEKEQFVCKTKQKQYMLLPIMRRKLYLFLYSGGLVSRCLSTILSCYLLFCDPYCPHSLGCEWNSLRSSQILAQFWSTHVPHH